MNTEDVTLDVDATANGHDDMAVATSAARSLKSILNDLITQLKQQEDVAVTITGDFKLEIGGRQAFNVSLFQDDEPDRSPALEFKIEQQAKNSIPDDTPETAAGARCSSGDTTNARLKRPRDDTGDTEPIDLTTDTDAPKRKRPHTARTPSDSLSLVNRAGLQHATISPDTTKSKPIAPPPPGPSDSTADHVKSVSDQIRWVEQCRRLADEAHDKREEKWRVTSATFHDDNRRKLDAHNAKVDSHNVWLSQEMLRQSTLLNQLMGEVKGLYPLMHTVKWETPANAFGAAAVPAPPPPAAASPTSYMPPYLQHRPGNAGPATKGSRNGGHPLNSRSWKPG